MLCEVLDMQRAIQKAVSPERERLERPYVVMSERVQYRGPNVSEIHKLPARRVLISS